MGWERSFITSYSIATRIPPSPAWWIGSSRTGGWDNPEKLHNLKREKGQDVIKRQGAGGMLWV